MNGKHVSQAEPQSAGVTRLGPATLSDADACQPAESDVPAVWQVGDVILDLYEVEDVVTSGGLGPVYRVYHRGWNVDLAVKSPRAEGRYAVSTGGDGDGNSLRLRAFDWELADQEPGDWDEGARPYLANFLTLHMPYGPDGLGRMGVPTWTEGEFQQLLTELGYRGYGWLRPEGVRRELGQMAAERG
jgi:hypothetical protein